MNWRRILAFIAWTAVLVPLFLGSLFLAVFGDCPEHVVSGWRGGTACSDHKRVAAWLVLIGFPLLWLSGGAYIFRRWSR